MREEHDIVGRSIMHKTCLQIQTDKLIYAEG